MKSPTPILEHRLLSPACKAIPAAIYLGLALISYGQDVPADPEAPKAVDLKERQEANKAVSRLRSKWVDYLKVLKETPEATTLRRTPPPNALLSPEAEKQQEALLTAPQRQSLARTTKNEYVEPEVLASKGGKLVVKLDAAHAHNHIGEDPVYLRAFNGKLVGPTLRVKRGDKIRLTLRNLMLGERWLPNMMNTLNSFNTINLHYHGLHVSPNGISDNVLIQVGPRETQDYEIDIPADHTPGTYWYHPHRHGSTAATVASGMSGALIIEGGLDDIPEIKAAKDRVMVLNQIPYVYKNTFEDTSTTPPTKIVVDLKEGEIEVKYADYIFGPGDWAKLGRYTTINGVQLPVIRLRPSQVERWRFVDSGQREMIKLRIVPNPKAGVETPAQVNFYEIAVDGLALGKMEKKSTVELWPGYRSDVLVQAPAVAGEYLLIDDASPASATISGKDKPLNYVGRIIVEGKPDVMKLPTDAQMADLRLPSIKDSQITGQQEAKYGILLVGGNVVFTIDGKSFDMETARQLKLGDVDEWTIRSVNDVGLVTHPFHIHVNPFEVTSIMAPPDPKDPTKLVEQLTDGPVWRDTVKIPGGGYVKMRTHYTDFIGTFVQHCHILDHEDQGMMQLIDIVDKNASPTASLRPVPAIDSAAPDFTLPDGEGKAHSLVDFQGKPTVVFFFKGHGCLHCAQQVAAFTEHYQSFLNKGVQVLGVTSDSVETLKTALADTPCPFPLLADPKGIAFAQFGCSTAGGLQHGTFTLDAGQRVKWRTVGASPFVGVESLVENLAPKGLAQNSNSPVQPLR